MAFIVGGVIGAGGVIGVRAVIGGVDAIEHLHRMVATVGQPSSSPPYRSVHTAAPVSTLRTFGATEADWRAAHRLATDLRLQSGCCWDFDPTLPQVTLTVDSGGYRYTEVILHLHGASRVLWLSHNFHTATTEAMAEAEIRSDFPADTRVVWSKHKEFCFQEEVQSATMGAVFATDKTISDPEGMALIEFVTGSSSNAYDSANVTKAQVRAGSNRPDEDLSC